MSDRRGGGETVGKGGKRERENQMLRLENMLLRRERGLPPSTNRAVQQSSFNTAQPVAAPDEPHAIQVQGARLYSGPAGELGRWAYSPDLFALKESLHA